MEIVRKLVRPVKRKAYQQALRYRSRRLGGVVDPQALEQVARFWGNAGYRGHTDYLEAVARAALDADGPILECGSGITTIIAAAYSRHEVWSLEHSPEWVDRTRSVAHTNAKVLFSPLRSYGDFEWYDVPSVLPDRFSMVICDGPPEKTTRGGRYGLLPVMSNRLLGATILLDDTIRESEREIAERWRLEFGVEIVRMGRYAVMRCGFT